MVHSAAGLVLMNQEYDHAPGLGIFQSLPVSFRIGVKFLRNTKRPNDLAYFAHSVLPLAFLLHVLLQPTQLLKIELPYFEITVDVCAVIRSNIQPLSTLTRLYLPFKLPEGLN